MRNMFKKYFIPVIIILYSGYANAQNFSGKVTDAEGTLLAGVEVYNVEDNSFTTTNSNGEWNFNLSNSNPKTLVFHKSNFTYEQLVKQAPALDLTVKLRKVQRSAATDREEAYKTVGCASVVIPNDSKWNVNFVLSELKGDLAPDQNFTRRDPSAVIKVNGKYYVWYSYSHTFDNNKIAPWDLNDIYYSTSTDGEYWEEQGLAVGRGAAGSFDARSVFTTEIFVQDGKYYLVYQAAANQDGIYNRNTVGMASAQSPDGPWTKLTEPILYPTYTNDSFFDNNAVHDPCLLFYNNKYYLYYKGECNCRGAAGCKNWCNPICGLTKQVKWGVAIADNPTGPFVKSEFNPITNTGHEVMVWPYSDGIAILQHQDGPEANSIQFAEDGVNFNIMGKVTNIPEAAGLYRADKSNTNPHAGINWGLGHKLMWNAGPKGWMHLYRFDIVDTNPTGINIIPDKIQIGIGQKKNVTFKLEPFEASATDLNWHSENENIPKIDDGGSVVGMNQGVTTIYATNFNGSCIDSCKIHVQSVMFNGPTVTTGANTFSKTGGTYNDASSGGPGFGVGKTSIGINFVNKNDWCTYSIQVPETGVYLLSYQISTPMDWPEVSMEINDVKVAQDKLYTNGAWDSYYMLNSDNLIYFDKQGSYIVKLIATGTDTWQWNLKSFSFSKIYDLDLNVGVNSLGFPEGEKIYSNPFLNQLIITGFNNDYLVSVYSLAGQKCYSSIHNGDTIININPGAKGTFIVKIVQNNKIFTSKILL